jgi:hypothetical protein
MKMAEELKEKLAKNREKRELPFMQTSYTASEYRQHLRGLPRAQQEAELKRLSPAEMRRLFPPELKV